MANVEKTIKPETSITAVRGLSQLGYHPILVAPFDGRGCASNIKEREGAIGKAPVTLYEPDTLGNPARWGLMKGWETSCREAPSVDNLVDQIRNAPVAPNIGVACGKAVGNGVLAALDVDTDAKDVHAGLAALFPDGEPPARRIGRVGAVLPFVLEGAGDNTSRDYRRGNEKVQILGEGRQFVVPPAIHPTTRRTYIWREPSGKIVPYPPAVSDLAKLHIDDIEAALRSLGFKRKEKERTAANQGQVAEIEQSLSAETADEITEADLRELASTDTTYATARENPPLTDAGSVDTSEYRMKMLAAVRHAKPGMGPAECAAWLRADPNCGVYKGASGRSKGEWNDEWFARHFANGAKTSSAFVAAVDDDAYGCEEMPAENLAAAKALADVQFARVLGDIDEKAETARIDAIHKTLRARLTSQEKIAEIERLAKIERPKKEDDDDEESEPAKAERFPVNTVTDILQKGFKPVTYLWRDLLATNTLTVVWGKDGASKTSLAINEAMPHAFGFDREGKPIERYGTLLVSLESVQDTENLIHGWLRANPNYQACKVEPAFGHMAAIGAGLHSRSLKAGALERAIKRRLKELEERFGVPVKVVVIDTLSMALLSDDGDETNESVNRTFTAANRILADMPGGAVVFLAHGDKDARTFRGAASIRQSSQGFIKMERNRGVVTIEIERLKGAAAGAKFKCRSEAIPMGIMDSEGREAVVFALTARERIGGPAVQSDGSALQAVSDDQGEAPNLPGPAEQPSQRQDRDEPLRGAMLEILKEAGKPLSRTDVLAKFNAHQRRQRPKGREIGATKARDLLLALVEDGLAVKQPGKGVHGDRFCYRRVAQV